MNEQLAKRGVTISVEDVRMDGHVATVVVSGRIGVVDKIEWVIKRAVSGGEFIEPVYAKTSPSESLYAEVSPSEIRFDTTGMKLENKKLRIFTANAPIEIPFEVNASF